MRGDNLHLDRQRALFEEMLRLTLEQRRYLIDGDLKGLEESNRLLGLLLERQAQLHREFTDYEGCADARRLAKLRQLADELKAESRTNYLLACRGAQFLEFSASALRACRDWGESSQACPAEQANEADQLPLHDQLVRIVDVRT